MTECVLIDDDELIHMTWRFVAREKGVTLHAFRTVDEFRAASARGAIGRELPIYIDSNLSDGVRGELAARDLSDAGYRNLFLSTGYTADRFTSMPWLRGVVGKEPPWES